MSMADTLTLDFEGSLYRSLLESLSFRGGVGEIVGVGGSGKSMAARQIAANAAVFPGGSEWFTGSQVFTLSDAIDSIADRLRGADGHVLVVVDDAEQLAAEDVYRGIRRLETGPWSVAFLLVSRVRIGLGGAVLQLTGDADTRLRALLARSFPGADEQMVDRLVDASGGSLLIAGLLIGSGRAYDLEPHKVSELLKPFELPGLLGPTGEPIRRGATRRAPIIGQVREVNDDLLRRVADDPRLLHTLDPRKFEELVAEGLSRRGFDVQLTPQTRDGGKDIYAAQHTDLGSFLYIVECKRYAPGNAVGVEVIRSLHGVANAERMNGAIVMTTSHFSADARTFAARLERQMSLRDFVAVRAWLQSIRPT